jgi:hypothetical protein
MGLPARKKKNRPIYNMSMEEASPGAAWPDDEPPIPMIHVDFPTFSSKSDHP